MAQATLQSYITQTRRLLHDATGKYWSDPDLIDAVNQAQRRVVVDSACLRSLQTVQLSANREVYTIGSLEKITVVSGGSSYGINPTNLVISDPPDPAATVKFGTTAAGTVTITGDAVSAVNITEYGSGYTTNPIVAAVSTGATPANLQPSLINPSILDVLNITVLWGTQRITLDRLPFTKFQAYMRSWIVPGQPRVCCSYGQSSWYIGPVPDQNYVSEWDVVLVPSDITNMSDPSPINYPYADALPYYAAHIAKFKEQSQNESDFFLQIYQRKMQHAIRAQMMRKLPSAYGS